MLTHKNMQEYGSEVTNQAGAIEAGVRANELGIVKVTEKGGNGAESFPMIVLLSEGGDTIRPLGRLFSIDEANQLELEPIEGATVVEAAINPEHELDQSQGPLGLAKMLAGLVPEGDCDDPDCPVRGENGIPARQEG